MAKTKEITFNCEDVNIIPNNGNYVTVIAVAPRIENILEGIDETELAQWISDHLNVEDVFSQSELEKWAESEGYIKADNQ